MKTFGKIMCVVLVLVLVCGGCFALWQATSGFKDWDPNNWGDNFKPDNNNDQSINSCTIVSEKYGTFVIPKENMFMSMDAIRPDNLFFSNNTNLQYLAQEFFDNMYQVYSALGNDLTELNEIKENGFYVGYNASQNYAEYIEKNYVVEKISTKTDKNFYAFNKDVFSYCGEEMFGGIFPANQMIYPNNFLCLGIFPKNIEELTLEYSNTYFHPFQDYQGLSINLKFITKKVEIKVENTQLVQYVPVAINSDKGYPLTERLYNELMKDTKTTINYN